MLSVELRLEVVVFASLKHLYYYHHYYILLLLLLLLLLLQVILAKPRAEVSKKGEAYRKWLCHIQFNLSVILLFY